MSGALTGVLLVAAAYLIGGIPWGYLIGRFYGGIDLRSVGSGGTGATNALRTMGKGASIAVLMLDLLKGMLPVLAAGWLGAGGWWQAAVAVATVAGHCWSPFIGFTGGKGVATGAGAAIAVCPPVALVVPLIAAIVWATRYVSLGSLVGTATATVGTVLLAATGRAGWQVPVAVFLITAIIFWQHRGNIERLRAGTERKFGERAAV
jgi:acyl phosphate:glycerol-3-phosphate acyltransferase